MTVSVEKIREFEKYLGENGCTASTTAQYSAAIKRILKVGSLEEAQKNVGLQTSYRMSRAHDLWTQFETDPSKFAEPRRRGRAPKGDDLFYEYLLKGAGLTPRTAHRYSSHLRAILKAGGPMLLTDDPKTFAHRAAVFIYARQNVSAYLGAWENFRALMRNKRNIELPSLHDMSEGPDVTPDQHLAVWVLWDVGYLSASGISKMKRETIRVSPCKGQVHFPSNKGEQTGKGCLAWAFDQFLSEGSEKGPLTGLSTQRIKELCASVNTVIEGDPLSTAHALTRTWSRQNRKDRQASSSDRA